MRHEDVFDVGKNNKKEEEEKKNWINKITFC